MIIDLKKIQFCMEGAELATQRLDYYQSYGVLFEQPPQKLQQIHDFKENLNTLNKEYLDLFIRPSNKYVFPCCSAYKSFEDQKDIKGSSIKNNEDQKENDHLIFEIKHMCSLIKKEKRQWQRKNYLIAVNFLYQEQNYLLDQLDWLPVLCAQIQKNSASRFYNEVALNLKNFFYFEKLLLEQILLKKINPLN